MPTSKHIIGVVGLWHLGEIYSAGLAELGHRVVGISEDRLVIENFKKDIPPLAEPGLVEIIRKNRIARRLTYSGDLKSVQNCDVVWITFDTPVNDRDESDLAVITATFKQVIPFLKKDVLIVLSSQIPSGTSTYFESLVRQARPRLSFHYVYSPENLRLGEALNCFLYPERIVIGANDTQGFLLMQDIFRKVKHAKLLRMSPASAEMTKHALNAFLATSISFINDIADACEEVGADVQDVIGALRSDPRIGTRAALGAGMGFSGGTLGRDLVALSQLGRKYGIPLPVINAVFKKNLLRPTLLVSRLEKILGELRGKQIVLYGLAYKPGTPTLRRSRSLEVARLLLKKGAVVVLSDRHVSAETIPHYKGARVEQDVYAAAKKADALVFITQWPDFQELNFALLKKAARPRAIILDSANFLRGHEVVIKKTGFGYYGIGR